MNSQGLDTQQVPPYDSSSLGPQAAKFPSPVPGAFRRHHYEATSPTTGQTHTRPASGKGPVGTEKGVGAKSEKKIDANSRTAPGSSVVPPDLYPLPGFLRTLLDQERALWDRNEVLLKTLKSKFSYDI